MLCMLLRKHIVGGRVREIRQIDADRILEIEFEHVDELGDSAQRHWSASLWDGIPISFSWARTGASWKARGASSEHMSSVREVLPGLFYERPPKHNKVPFDAPGKRRSPVRCEMQLDRCTRQFRPPSADFRCKPRARLPFAPQGRPTRIRRSSIWRKFLWPSHGQSGKFAKNGNRDCSLRERRPWTSRRSRFGVCEIFPSKPILRSAKRWTPSMRRATDRIASSKSPRQSIAF